MNSLCCELLPWHLASGRLTSCLLGMGHLEKGKDLFGWWENEGKENGLASEKNW